MGVTEKVILTDRTLCAESARALSFKEKLEILKQLDRMKADCVALGRIGNSKTDPLLIATVAPLLQDSTLRERLSRGARTFFEENLTAHVMTAQMEAYYLELLQKKRGKKMRKKTAAL
jgi:isopropylmalate/homocitrate/citramalate synthase